MSTPIHPPTTEEWLAIERELHERPSNTPSPSPLSGFLKFNMVSAWPVPSYRDLPSSASPAVGADFEEQTGFMDVIESVGQLDGQVECLQESYAIQLDQMEQVEDPPRFQCTSSSTITDTGSSSSDDWTNWFKHM